MRQHLWHCVFLLGLLGWAVSSSAGTVVLDPAAPAAAEINLISESRGEIILELHFGIVQLDSDSTDRGVCTQLSVPGTTPASRSGWPEVPQKSLWVQVSGEHVRAEVLEAATVHRYWGVALPAAEPLMRLGEASLRRQLDPEFYEVARIYPESPVEVSLSGKLGDVPVALVTLSPVQYRSNTREWIVHTRLRVRITSRGGNHLDRPLTVPIGSLAERVVINPHVTQDSSEGITPRMLLVTVPEYLSVLQPFVEWKIQSGLPVQTILYPEVATDATSLRSYIRSVCDSLNPPPQFLLLVGDVNVIPPFFGVSSSLTDHPYSLRDDNDYLPDLSVGRVPCQGVADCGDWVARLLAYERDGAFVQNPSALVFSSSVAQDPQHGIFVTDLLESAGMSVDPFQEPETGTRANVVNSLNAGRQWVFYIGHGYAQGWTSIHPEFTTLDVSQLTSELPSITVAVACATADLDYPGMSLAEFWLARPGSRGPLAYLGATESTAFFRSDTLGIGTLRAVFEQGCEYLGTAVDWGRLATAQCFPQGSGGLTEETIQQFALLGDPSMRVYSQPPQPLEAGVPEVLPLAATEIQFTVNRTGSSVGDANVCVMSDSAEFYAVEHTNALGIATVPIQFTSPIALRWTVTAHNALASTGTLSVVPDSGAFIQVYAVEVVDTAGDGDGRADRSESCGLRVTLQNNGMSGSAAGEITVVCTSPLTEIPVQSLTFTSLAPRERRTLDETILFTVSDSAAEGDAVPLDMMIRTGESESLRTIRSLELHAPQMVFCGSSVGEDSGDGDGQAEGGERLLLSVRFCNEGGEDLRAPACSLSLPPIVQQISLSVSAETCPPGDTLTVVAQLQAVNGVPRGSPLEYGYSLWAANSPPLIGWDMQRIGQVPVYLYVLDLMPQEVDEIAAALTSLGVEYERGNSLPSDLFRYASIWIFCGVYPNAVALAPGYADRLTQYLAGGGLSYWEGGDVWAFDPPTSLRPMFHINGVNDGTSDAGPVSGEYGTAYAAYHFGYAGENSFMDQLEPQPGALVMLRNARLNATYPVCIAYAGESYRTVGSSIELGSLSDSTYPSTRVRLVRDILTWFDIESPADVLPPEVQHVPQSEYPFANRPVEIIADVQDASGLNSVVLEYRVYDSTWQATPMTPDNGSYRGELPGEPFGTTVHYHIRAADASPLHNVTVTDDFATVIVARPDLPFELVLDQGAFARLRPHISGHGSWSITDYPDDVPVLELHGGDSVIAFTTDEFDCSRLETVGLSFWHYLREIEPRSSNLARVSGSTDGGVSFPYPVWSYTPEQGGVQEEGTVVIQDMNWAAGKSHVALRFEFSGRCYWRLRDIRVTGRTSPVTVPVDRTVIAAVPEGIRLAWPSVPAALAYTVLASTSLNGDDDFAPIAQLADTTFTDTDLSFSHRYYEVRAVIEKSSSQALSETPPASTGPAPLRLPDLRWNVKLSSQPPR